MSVREVEEMVRKLNLGKSTSKDTDKEVMKYINSLADRLSKRLGYTTQIMKLSRGGKITIRYNTNQELEEIVGKIDNR